MARRRLERDWPVLPIPLFLFEDVCYELARASWTGADTMPPFEVKDRGMLESTLAQPYQRFNGAELYPTVRAKAACLFRGLIKNHPLVDGNKRVAVTTVGTFLWLNGYRMTATDNQVRDYALRIARQRGEYSMNAVVGWFQRHTEFLPATELNRRRQFNLRFYRTGSPIEEWFAR